MVAVAVGRVGGGIRLGIHDGGNVVALDFFLVGYW